MKKLMTLFFTLGVLGIVFPAHADDYVIDTKGAHASINFRIQHLGYSWLFGRFDDFSGTFSYDENKPEATAVEVSIRTKSINTNHAERDKHLRSEDFFAVDKYPTARFVSTAFEEMGDGAAVLKGNLTLRGVTRPVTINVKYTGHGEDPWGGYRRGFIGTTDIVLKDFAIPMDLGPASAKAELTLAVEGVRQ